MTPLDGANAIVRAWTRLYTWRLPAVARDCRRAEIDSDLWEFEHDREGTNGAARAAHVLARLLRGLPDDVRWRASFVSPGAGPLRAMIGLTTAAIVATGVWVYALTSPVDLPSPAPLVRIVEVFPPPPPPPPPPPRVIRRDKWAIVIHPAPQPSRSRR